MMNVQEFATLAKLNLPVKIILVDNDGYSMVRQTEDQWLGGVNVGSSSESGLGFPNFDALFEAFDIRYSTVDDNVSLGHYVNKLINTWDGPFVLRVVVPHDKRVVPKVAFGYPIEDGEPFLPRDEFLENMKIPLLPVSQRS